MTNLYDPFGLRATPAGGTPPPTGATPPASGSSASNGGRLQNYRLVLGVIATIYVLSATIGAIIGWLLPKQGATPIVTTVILAVTAVIAGTAVMLRSKFKDTYSWKLDLLIFALVAIIGLRSGNLYREVGGVLYPYDWWFLLVFPIFLLALALVPMGLEARGKIESDAPAPLPDDAPEEDKKAAAKAEKKRVQSLTWTTWFPLGLFGVLAVVPTSFSGDAWLTPWSVSIPVFLIGAIWSARTSKIKPVLSCLAVAIVIGLIMGFAPIGSDNSKSSTSSSKTEPSITDPNKGVEDKSSMENAVNNGKFQISDCSVEGLNIAIADANASEAFGGSVVVTRAKFAVFYPTMDSTGGKIGYLQATTKIASKQVETRSGPKSESGLTASEIEKKNPQPIDTTNLGQGYFAGFILGETPETREYWVCKLDQDGVRVVEKMTLPKQ